MADMMPRFLSKYLWGSAAVGALMVTLLIAPAGEADDAASAAAAPAATAPAEPALDQVERILTLTKAERSSLIVAQSRPTQLSDSALTMMLARTAALPALSDEEFRSLDRPSFRNLVKAADRWSARPIRLTVYVWYVQELTAGTPGEIAASREWPQGKKVWRMDVTDADGSDPRGQALRIFSVVDPFAAGVLPKPSHNVDGELQYRRKVPKVELAGVFYKVWQAEDRDTEQRSQRDTGKGTITLNPTMRSYPVVLVWQFGGGGGWTINTGRYGAGAWAMLIGGLALLGLVFFMMRRVTRVRRRMGQPGRRLPSGYRPLRDEDADSDPDDQMDDASDAIDPAVTAAAEAYRRRRAQEQANG